MERPRSNSSSGVRRSHRRQSGSSSGQTSKSSSKRSSSSGSSRPKTCRQCGQHHSHHEPHLYNYKGEVDEDLMCQICLQPFVQPMDTPCGHTFCSACLHAYLRVNPMCPLDRKPVHEMTISPTNLVLRRLLDKLEVTCPNSDSCEEELQRGSLDDHLKYRCSGTLVACQFAGAGCDYRGPSKSMAKHRGECKFKKEGKSEITKRFITGRSVPVVNLSMATGWGNNPHFRTEEKRGYFFSYVDDKCVGRFVLF